MFALPETTSAADEATEEVRLQEGWRVEMAKVALPKRGTFEATYPNKEWKEVKSTTRPPYPYLPRRGPKPLTVGGGNDVSVQAPTGLISSATGSFDSVTGVTSESGQINATGPAVANAYSLQLNTNPFTTTGCSGSPEHGVPRLAAVRVRKNDGTTGTVFIQYWLLQI